MLPIYWLVSMSFKTDERDPRLVHAVPADLDAANYITIFTDPTWYMGYVNSIIYVTMNTVISVLRWPAGGLRLLALPLLGDKHLFFWLLTNRMAPPAVFALPFFQLYSAVGLFDTHLAVALAHCCSTCRWRSGSSKASCRGVPKELDETAYVDGYSFPASS
jgi:glycerol transport system permease protein